MSATMPLPDYIATMHARAAAGRARKDEQEIEAAAARARVDQDNRDYFCSLITHVGSTELLHPASLG
jgi:hypothetical protein